MANHPNVSNFGENLFWVMFYHCLNNWASDGLAIIILDIRRIHWVAQTARDLSLHLVILVCIPLGLAVSFLIIFFKKWANPGLYWFLVFSTLHHSKNLLKHTWCAWDSNPGRQNGRLRRIQWAIAAPLFSSNFTFIGCHWAPRSSGVSKVCQSLEYFGSNEVSTTALPSWGSRFLYWYCKDNMETNSNENQNL